MDNETIDGMAKSFAIILLAILAVMIVIAVRLFFI